MCNFIQQAMVIHSEIPANGMLLQPARFKNSALLISCVSPVARDYRGEISVTCKQEIKVFVIYQCIGIDTA